MHPLKDRVRTRIWQRQFCTAITDAMMNIIIVMVIIKMIIIRLIMLDCFWFFSRLAQIVSFGCVFLLAYSVLAHLGCLFIMK